MSDPKPGDVVVTRRHRELVAVEYYSPTSYRHRQVLKWIEKGEPNAGVNDCLVRFALALATIEHNARRDAWGEGYDAALSDIGQKLGEDAPVIYDSERTASPYALPEPPKEPSR